MKRSHSFSLVSTLVFVSSAAVLANCAGELEDEDAFAPVKGGIKTELRDPSKIATEPVQPTASAAPAQNSAAPEATSAAPVVSSAAPGASSARPAASTPAPAPSASGAKPMLPANCNALSLLGTKCGGCHPGLTDLNLKTATINSLFNVSGPATGSSVCSAGKLIDGTKPEESLLITKLNDSPPCGTDMKGVASLTAVELKCITDWTLAVAQGAR